MFPSAGTQRRGECVNRWRFKQTGIRQFDIENGAQTRDDLDGKQGVAANFKKIVVHTDALQPENFTPYGGHL